MSTRGGRGRRKAGSPTLASTTSAAAGTETRSGRSSAPRWDRGSRRLETPLPAQRAPPGAGNAGGCGRGRGWDRGARTNPARCIHPAFAGASRVSGTRGAGRSQVRLGRLCADRALDGEGRPGRGGQPGVPASQAGQKAAHGPRLPVPARLPRCAHSAPEPRRGS